MANLARLAALVDGPHPEAAFVDLGHRSLAVAHVLDELFVAQAADPAESTLVELLEVIAIGAFRTVTALRGRVLAALDWAWKLFNVYCNEDCRITYRQLRQLTGSASLVMDGPKQTNGLYARK